MPFTVQLLSLKCVQAQENDGDEMYILVNGKQVYSVGTARMSDQLTEPEVLNEVDFETGRQHTAAGWEPLPGYDAGEYTFTGLTEPAVVQLREKDLLLGDDQLGRLVLDEKDVGRGAIQQSFTRDGAHYLLRVRVTA